MVADIYIDKDTSSCSLEKESGGRIEIEKTPAPADIPAACPHQSSPQNHYANLEMKADAGDSDTMQMQDHNNDNHSCWNCADNDDEAEAGDAAADLV